MAMCWGLINGRAEDELPRIGAGEFDCVITDPPYPCVKRPYGTWTVEEWDTMMRAVVRECVRIVGPRGSSAFVLQPNSERFGLMRTWLWDFLSWAGREFGIVQDAYWWNHTTPPVAGCRRPYGLMRPSLKYVVWVGKPDCYRNQDAVLWAESESNAAKRAASRALRRRPSGVSMRDGQCRQAAVARGGVTPFNVLPIANADSQTSAGARGHGAGTPLALCDWWVRYICPPSGRVLDPFAGSGTIGVAALKRGCGYLGIEKEPAYCDIARERLSDGDILQ